MNNSQCKKVIVDGYTVFVTNHALDRFHDRVCYTKKYRINHKKLAEFLVANGALRSMLTFGVSYNEMWINDEIRNNCVIKTIKYKKFTWAYNEHRKHEKFNTVYVNGRGGSLTHEYKTDCCKALWKQLEKTK